MKPYGHQWEKERRAFLRSNPLCSMCAASGRITASSVVDHIIPHKGDNSLFWDSSNWQAVCTSCHNSIKQTQEIHGYSQAADVSGMPQDPQHPWNTGARTITTTRTTNAASS